MKRAIWLFCTGLAMVSLQGTLKATTLSFSFSGRQESAGFSAMGSGSFSFADGLTSVTEASLTSFSFVDVVSYNGMFSGGPSSTTYTYGLANLTGFSLALTNGAPGVFTLSTDNAVPGFASAFSVPDIGVSGPPYLGVAGIAINGPVTFSPEPITSALVILSGALLCIPGIFRKRLPELNS